MDTGQASLSITVRVSDSGHAVAPFYIVVRGTRFERRAAPNPLPPITFWGTGTAKLPVYVNVWDYDPFTQDQDGDGQYDPVTLPTRTALCTAGWRICVGDSFCLAAPLNMLQNPATYAICAVPAAAGVAFQSSGTASARLWIRVQPRGRLVMSRPYSTSNEPTYYWRYVGDPPVLTRYLNGRISVAPVDVVGTLVLPWMISGDGRPARVGENVYSTYLTSPLDVGVVQQERSAYQTYSHYLGIMCFTGNSQGNYYSTPPNPSYSAALRISTYAPERATAMSIHSMMPGHVRCTGHLYELEIWPDGQASLLRRDRKTGTYSNQYPTVAGVYALDDNPYENVKLDTLLPRAAQNPTPGYASAYNRTANTLIVDTFLEDTAVYGGDRAVALLDMRVGLSGQAVAPLLIGVGAGRGYPRIWLVTEVGEQGVSTAPLQIEVGEQGVALADLALIVGALGAAVAAVRVEVGTTAVAIAPLSVWVHPVGVDASVWWDCSVTVGGVDVSARVLGEVEVEAEAGVARLAHFRLAPTSDPLALFSVGADLVVIAYRPPGSQDWSTLFSGRLATMDIDINTGVLSYSASDGRAAILDAMTASEIADITPGALYSPAVQGHDLVGAALANARMQTVAADLDLSPTGSWRVSPWERAAVPHHEYTRVVDGSLSVQLPRYTEVVNRVDVRFQYRYPVLADRACRVNWSIGGPLNNLWWITRAMLTEAVEQDGWRVEDGAIWSPASGDGHLAAAELTARRRYAQWVTEDYHLTIRAPLSEAAHGSRPGGNATASLSVDYDDAGWVDNPGREPQLAAEGSMAAEPRYPVTDQVADGRGAADAALSTLLSIARVDILRSLRGGRITATVACDPSIDLPDTIAINVGRCVAQGRVIRVVHRLSGDDGRATTEFELACFFTPGSNPDPTDLCPPPPPEHPDPDLAGCVLTLDSVISTDEPDWEETGLRLHYAIHTETESYRYFEQTREHEVTYWTPLRTQFGVDLPPIPTTDVDPVTLQVTAEYSVAVPSDPITLIS